MKINKIISAGLFMVLTFHSIVFADSYLPKIRNEIHHDKKTMVVQFNREHEPVGKITGFGYWVEYIYGDNIDAERIELMDLDFYFRYINYFIFSNTGRTGKTTNGRPFGISMHALFGSYLECELSNGAFSDYIADILIDYKKLSAAFESIPVKSERVRKYRRAMLLYFKDMIRSYDLLRHQAIYKSSSHLSQLYKEMPYLNKDSIKQEIKGFIYNDAQCRYDYHIFTTLEKEVRNKYLSAYDAKFIELKISEAPKDPGD
jgi:hypothetical protein